MRISVNDMSSGESEDRTFHNLYSLIPCKPHPFLQEAGLLNPSGLLNVDP
jgi:hypothetical protein